MSGKSLDEGDIYDLWLHSVENLDLLLHYQVDWVVKLARNQRR